MTKSRSRRGGGGAKRAAGGSGGGGQAKHKSQSGHPPTENTGAAGASATPTTTTPTVTKPRFVVEKTGATPQDDDTGMCWVCRESVKYYSVSECNHRTCHVCALRLRALYKKQECIFCKEPQPSLIFTTSPTATFASFGPSDIPYRDTKLPVFFETREMMNDTLTLLRLNCPDEKCDYFGSGWSGLKLHVRGVHGLLMCDLCIRMKKIFAHEQPAFPPSLMPYHLPSTQPRGQPQKPKGVVDIEAHPMCEFCRECTLGDDELFAHMREKHEECFICKRNGTLHKYFKDFEALETHFTQEHHPCKRRACLDQKFVVFGTGKDLKDHMVEVHSEEVPSRDRRDAWGSPRVGFGFEDLGGYRRRGSGGSYERDRDSPLQLQSPSLRQWAFGPGWAADTPASSSSIPPRTPDADPEYDVLHTKIARATAKPPRPMGAVGLSFRSYRNSESTARDLISSIWNVLDRSLDTSAIFVNTVADLLDDEDKREDLLTTWDCFEIEKRYFRDPVSTSIGTEDTDSASGRVLGAKRRMSWISRRQTLDQVASAASSSTWPLPQSPPVNHSHPSPPILQLPAKPIPTSNRRRQGSNSIDFRPYYPGPVSTSEPEPKRTVTSPLSSEFAFPGLPTVVSNKSLKKTQGDTLPAKSAWSRGPPLTWSWSPPEHEFQFDPESEPDSEPEPEPEAEPYPEPEPTTADGRDWKGKQKQTLLHGGDCTCFSCFPSLSPY